MCLRHLSILLLLCLEFQKGLDGTTKSHGLEDETTEFLKWTLPQGRVWLGWPTRRSRNCGWGREEASSCSLPHTGCQTQGQGNRNFWKSRWSMSHPSQGIAQEPCKPFGEASHLTWYQNRVLIILARTEGGTNWLSPRATSQGSYILVWYGVSGCKFPHP